MAGNAGPEPDFSTASGAEIGRALRGFGVNLLVRDGARSIEFLTQALGFSLLRFERGFALLRRVDVLVQLHEDPTYHENPLPGLLPEAGPRGGGVELRLYDCDPDQAEARARARGDMIFRECRDRPHGLRECYILDPDGYCWVPSRRLA